MSALTLKESSKMASNHINIREYAEWRQKILKSFQVEYSNYLDETPLSSAIPPRAPDVSIQAYVEYLLKHEPAKENH